MKLLLVVLVAVLLGTFFINYSVLLNFLTNYLVLIVGGLTNIFGVPVVNDTIYPAATIQYAGLNLEVAPVLQVSTKPGNICVVNARDLLQLSVASDTTIAVSGKAIMICDRSQ